MIVPLLFTLSGNAVTGWLMQEPDCLPMLPDLPQIVAPAHADDDGEREYGASGAGKKRSRTARNLCEPDVVARGAACKWRGAHLSP
jgi:hypothetical protein